MPLPPASRKARTAAAKPSSGPSIAVYSRSCRVCLGKAAVDQRRLAVADGVADHGVAVGHGRSPSGAEEHAFGLHGLDLARRPKPSAAATSALCWPRSGATLADRGVAVREAERQVGQPQRAEPRMLLLDHHAARLDLRIGKHLVDALHLGARHVDARRAARSTSATWRLATQGLTTSRISSRCALRPFEAHGSACRRRSRPGRRGPPPTRQSASRRHRPAPRSPGRRRRRGTRRTACEVGMSWPVCSGSTLPPRQRVALHRVLVHRHQRVVQRHVDVLAAAAR